MHETRSAFLANLRAEFDSRENVFTLSHVLLSPGGREQIEDSLRKQYEALGRELYLDDAERFGYWDGQFSKELAEFLALAITANVQEIVVPVAPMICPLYCRLKADGTLASEGFNLTVAIADVLLACGTQIPFPIVQVAVYATKNHILDRCCLCEG